MITDGSQHVEGVYEDGILRPLAPVNLPDHRHVYLTITTLSNDDAGEVAVSQWLDRECIQLAEHEADRAVTLNDVRQMLTDLPGSLSDLDSSERDER